MHVERIEIIGFKSFCDKTVIDLHPGITSIVGPNGCGKSNVVDAFKWVLGEQSAKSLRGGTMEDVIFFGSANKKSKGMAEVTLVLSGIDEQPSDADGNNGSGSREISVSRRLYRSGESDYLLNKVPCRLKDIKDILLDTGLELKAYSILEQGRINHILNSKPQDRRFLIEEVAGVMKYKARKAEAIRKLDSSKSNLQRLSDIISEIKRQIGSIDRHAKKAERYKKLFEEMKQIDLKIGKRDMDSLRTELTALASSENDLNAKDAEVAARLHSSEALIEEKKRSCTDTEKMLGEARSRFYLLEKEVTESEGEIALLKRDCENLKDRIGHLAVRDKESLSIKEEALANLENIEKESAAISESLLRLNTVLEEKNNIFQLVQRDITESERSLESERRGLFSKAEEISAIRNEISRILVTIENLNLKTEKNSEDISSVKDNLVSLEDVINDTRNKFNEAGELLKVMTEDKQKLINDLSIKKEELSSSEALLYKDREDFAALASKLESLTEVYDSRKSKIDEIVKVLSHVSDIFETSPEYEIALEAILGEKLNASVVQDHSELARALNHIKEQKSKRSGFISVSQAKASYADTTNANAAAGVIGRAVDFINVKQEFNNVASALLSDVLFVDNIDTAFSCWRTGTSPAYYVTLDGEVLEPSGIVFAGTEKGVLKIKRQIKELEKDISDKKTRIADSEGLVKRLRDEIIRIENNIIVLGGEISDKEKYCHELKVKLSGMDEENTRHQRKLEFLSIETDEGRSEQETLKKTLAEKNHFCELLINDKNAIEEKISSAQGSITENRTRLEALRSELTQVKLDQTSINEKMLSFTRERDRLERSITDIEKKKSEMLNERNSMEESIVRKEAEISRGNEALMSKVIKIEETRGEVSNIEEILGAKTAEVELLERQQKTYTSELDVIRKELSHVEVKKMESSMRYDYRREDIRKSYSIDIENALIDSEVTPEEEERLPQLKAKIEEIGQVNLGTLDEYEELKTRYEFMAKQQDDVVSSITALEETISKINQSTKQRLRDAFDALNEKFKEVFTTLFGNGKAELILTEDDILEAGIEIVAQPPGKKLKNLMALSGGEQALTTLSLLFAGFLVKPTPVCILDEVDAPLDESNTGRFIELLTEMSKNIQFIAITHNRITMEAADYIYGVTMEEPGSSKVVSMHMADIV
ncbi:MAG: chromosome segregation protein SMC [Thermodesulfovibrionia bacterium]|nr:chromosome segregation protein SMC [Thermodesulfovibrionia bacterium]